MLPGLFLQFDPAIQLHVAAALAALLLGPVVLLRRRRDALHRALGYTWVSAMALTALSSFAIHGLALVGPFGPIHILSVVVLVGLWRAIGHARRGEIAAHRRTMESLYSGAVIGAGLFTLVPGRRMSALVLGDAGWTGFVVAALLAMMIWGLLRMSLRQVARG